MKRLAALTLAMVAWGLSAAPAHATSTIIVGNYVYSWNVYELDLYVTGDDQIAALDLAIVLSGPPGPVITAIDITGPGTIFAGNNVGQSLCPAPDDLPGLTPFVSTKTAFGTVLANGLLARLTIDMTNGPSGPGGAFWPLSLTGHELGSTKLSFRERRAGHHRHHKWRAAHSRSGTVDRGLGAVAAASIGVVGSRIRRRRN